MGQESLSAKAYTCSSYLEQERQRIFSRYWVCAGLASDLPDAGDVYPTEVAGMPIVLVRDRQQTIRAFHNICRHRGLQLVKGACTVKGGLRCPYHSWTYKLDGTLKSTPHFGGYYKDTCEGFNRTEKGLMPIRCEQWLDMIFVDLSGEAPPLAAYLQPMIERWSGYDFGLLRREAREVRLECNANWKLAVENFSESYHLTWVHPALNTLSRMEDHFGFDVGDIHVGQGSLKYNSGVVNGKSLPVFPGLADMKKQTVAEYITIFPNLMLGVHPDYFLVFIVDPLSPDRSVERMVFYFVGDEAMTSENQALRHLPIDLWKLTNDEDIDMIERMQTGRRSPSFDGGCFSPELERTVYRFQQNIGRAVSVEQ
ncbi:aromatic ring-hydroxylating dioxygenase subunit alpha [cf. Phormidesmis sp. LEGE 11477]|uniref:aromatic ring-hydroxylating oxygenase subunit alpha n=1 Tax=cf. Phormidesmis sp. LEGE 11477 TaxID=1828680 RepID=UPI00187E7D63|nr:aromatic ring-hydroxylating dioxygenase subunit alpha [cf. Phormidesmis sp. LEGE 11477]MBE9059591.1 aromatic ring-hydroxylating dioxygenase subunit alpha [cf. Phormidesmis sp. LEGE 11477]